MNYLFEALGARGEVIETEVLSYASQHELRQAVIDSVAAYRSDKAVAFISYGPADRSHFYLVNVPH